MSTSHHGQGLAVCIFVFILERVFRTWKCSLTTFAVLQAGLVLRFCRVWSRKGPAPGSALFQHGTRVWHQRELRQEKGLDGDYRKRRVEGQQTPTLAAWSTASAPEATVLAGRFVQRCLDLLDVSTECPRTWSNPS